MPDSTNQTATGGTPEPANTQPGASGTQAPEAQTPPLPETFEAFLDAQPAEIQGLYETHTKGLKAALDSERSQRGDLTKQLRELLPKAEKGSELEATLNATMAKLEDAERRAEFLEEATKPEIGCRSKYIKTAYMAAQAEGMIDAKGRVDWLALKAAYPEMFGEPTPKGNAGNGTQAPPAAAISMNDLIRRKAGRA